MFSLERDFEHGAEVSFDNFLIFALPTSFLKIPPFVRFSHLLPPKCGWGRRRLGKVSLGSDHSFAFSYA